MRLAEHPSRMDYPAWYPEWRSEAFAELKAKNAQLERAYGIGSGGQYHYDLPTASLVFRTESGATSVADIEVVGTTSGTAGNWLWAWANPDFDDELTGISRSARRFGDQHGICPLTHDFVSPEAGVSLNGLGWELTSASARIADAIGAYRPPDDDGGAIFFIIKAIRLTA
jgi:hypothetical protein